MNFCKCHWDELREAIKARDLEQYVKDGKTLFGQEVDKLKNRMGGEKEFITLETFDPLFSASCMIFSGVMDHAGLSLLSPDPDTGKPRCPVCVLAAPVRSGWINGASDEMAWMIGHLKNGPVDPANLPPR